MLFHRALARALAASAVLVAATQLFAQTSPRLGYYRDPAVHGDMLVFTSEGDLWTVAVSGGAAHRLTSNSGVERMASISPDGQTVAFAAHYEGPGEVYTMPVSGGMPKRMTWNGDASPAGWSPDGRLIISTKRYSTLPDPRLVLIGTGGKQDIIPLASGAEAAYSSDGHTLFFTRFQDQGSHTKRYKGGFIQNLWRYNGSGEATPITTDYEGISRNPMFWNGRVYFLSDRTGVMNVFSVDPAGHDLKQESHQKIFDVESASVSDGHVVYSCAAELWNLDLKSSQDAVIPITLASDFDQLREHWVKDPIHYVTDTHAAPDGHSAVFTSRGELFVLPVKSGRVVKVAGDSAIRYRSARFSPDGKSIIALSTSSGETEFWRYPANGIGKPEQLTKDAKVLRWDGITSPDGRWLANWDKDQQLWVFDTKSKQNKLIAQSRNGDFDGVRWSPDSRWLAYVETASNHFDQIRILNVESGKIETITSDRYNSADPVWSTDGKWMYFLSDRSLKTSVGSPWGPRQPNPHFANTMKLYELALKSGERSPFLAPDELHPETPEKEEKEKQAADDKKKSADKTKDKAEDSAKHKDKKADVKAHDDDKKKVPEVTIDFTDTATRLMEVPVPAGNYHSLQSTEKRLCWLNASNDEDHKNALQCIDIANKGDDPDTLMSDVAGYEVTQDRKKIFIRRHDDFFMVESDAKGSGLGDQKALGKQKIDLSRWTITTTPREEFHGIFLDAWRLERDYFYDRNMHGVNWVAMRDRYLPLADRAADRDELNDVIAQMVSELSALHTFVGGGDARKPSDQIDVAALGAELRRDEKSGGYTVAHIYLYDTDLPNQAPPFARPDSLIHEGETIMSIDGADLLNVRDERELLRGKAGTPVLLKVKSAKGELRDVLVKPIKARDDRDLRYAEWEYTRRQAVDTKSDGQIGYVHLRAMGSGDIEQWAREYYPVYRRQGLIIDVRHNNGGNIDSWLLGDLLRKAWFYWQPRVGDPDWNMQYAFRGHVVVLCDEATASDGEAFSEGIKRLNIGKVIGTRTWGGEIWLSGSNVEADGGIATAAETGVYGPDGKWLIEGHGVDPDIVVDNLPHATFGGDDAQLQAGIDYLKRQIQSDPRPIPQAPPYPNKSFKY